MYFGLYYEFYDTKLVIILQKTAKHTSYSAVYTKFKLFTVL